MAGDFKADMLRDGAAQDGAIWSFISQKNQRADAADDASFRNDITGRETEFEKAWAEVTEAISRLRGSRGSRLHTTAEPRLYIAYAQWPSAEIFDRNVTGYTETELASFARMKDAAESMRLLHRMDVKTDLLR